MTIRLGAPTDVHHLRLMQPSNKLSLCKGLLKKLSKMVPLWPKSNNSTKISTQLPERALQRQSYMPKVIVLVVGLGVTGPGVAVANPEFSIDNHNNLMIYSQK